MPLGLYIHIPFCKQGKCPYCDFYSVCYTDGQADAYTAAVIRNLRHYSTDAAVDTVYFGGGTPVLMGERLCTILAAVRECFALTDDAEITLEANPAEADEHLLAVLRKGGFNRISFGLQSANDEELQALGRRHTAAEGIAAIHCAKAAGFTNISADLMLATPKQTPESLDQTLDRFAALPLTHVSAYLLKIEEGTPFHTQRMWEHTPDEDTEAALYLHTVERLSAMGFMQYEISNFAREGCSCRHNLKYWRCEEYLGIGPAAHSYYQGKRFAVEEDLAAFLSADAQQTAITDDMPGTFEETVMLALRLNEGLDLSECAGRFAVNATLLSLKCLPMEQSGLLLNEGSRIRLTPRGMLVSNEVIGRILF